MAQFLSQGRSGAISPAVIIGVFVMIIAVIGFVVFMERALRKIHIQYPRRQVGMKVYDGGSSHLPVKVNPAGVIPAIFASSLLLLPTTVSTFSGQQTGPVMSTILAYFGPGQPLYLLFFTAMIVFFTFFYTFNVSFKTEDVADNLFNPDPYYQQGGDMVRVGGLGYRIDISKPQGGRITEMTSLSTGESIDPSRSYAVAGWASVNEDTQGPPIWDVVEAHIRKLGTVSVKPNTSVKVDGI